MKIGVTLSLMIFVLFLSSLSPLWAKGKIRFFTGSRNNNPVTETIRIEVKFQNNRTGEIYDFTGKKAIKGEVDIPPDHPQNLKNELIEAAVLAAIGAAAIPAFSGSSLIVGGNSNSYVSVDENVSPGQIYGAKLLDWTCTNKSDQKGLKSCGIPASCHVACVCVALWDDPEGIRKVQWDHLFQIGFVTAANVPILAEIRTHGQYADPQTGETQTGFKPVEVVLKEAARELLDLSAAAGTPLDGVVVYRNGLFFDAEQRCVLYGEDSPWLVQNQSTFPAGSNDRAREWIDLFSDLPVESEIELTGSATEKSRTEPAK
jgi:hypothetical protein